MKKTVFGILFACLCVCSCSEKQKSSETIALIETDLGDIRVKLYNETPKHRDNFIKLANEGFYDSLLFHRVIPEFMIQGGDPLSKNALSTTMLGSGDTGELIPAEFCFPRYFHKRGALAAAREGDDKNPEMQSSGCQFYLVYGKTFTDRELNEIERSRKEKTLQKIVNRLVESDDKNKAMLEQSDDIKRIQLYMDSVRTEAIGIYEAELTPFAFPEEVRQVYRTEGGTPWLDDNYTVFGEVTEGLEVIDRIQQVKTGSMNRPAQDIKMKIKIIKP